MSTLPCSHQLTFRGTTKRSFGVPEVVFLFTAIFVRFSCLHGFDRRSATKRALAGYIRRAYLVSHLLTSVRGRYSGFSAGSTIKALAVRRDVILKGRAPQEGV